MLSRLNNVITLKEYGSDLLELPFPWQAHAKYMTPVFAGINIYDTDEAKITILKHDIKHVSPRYCQ